jgi:hypothetical protein
VPIFAQKPAKAGFLLLGGERPHLTRRQKDVTFVGLFSPEARPGCKYLTSMI